MQLTEAASQGLMSHLEDLLQVPSLDCGSPVLLADLGGSQLPQTKRETLPSPAALTLTPDLMIVS